MSTRSTPAANAERIRAALRCDRSGCACQRPGPSGPTHCPSHDDEAPSLSVDVRDGRVLLCCHAGCDQRAVIDALRQRGLWPVPAGRENGRGRETRYALRDEAGRLVAVHVRLDTPAGKVMWWEQPDGARGLGGRPTAALPLYGVHRLNGAERVVLCEGEKAAEALAALGVAAVGTVTGAAGTPSDASLRPLLGRTICLWPDADEHGRQHMRRIAERLLALGADPAHLRWVEWPAAPAGGDAADFVGRGRGADDVDLLLLDAGPPPVRGDDDTTDAGERTEAADGNATADGDRGGNASQATRLVRLACEQYEFFQSEDGEPLAVPRAGPPVALRLRGGGGGLRAALAARYAEAYGRVPSASALTDALAVLEGRALTSPRRRLALRLARHGDAIVLDLGRADGLCAIIRPGWWEVAPTPPGITWRRTKLTAELPVPVRGGDLAALRALLNFTPDAWDLFVSALVAACIPDIPHAIEVFRGPEGSGKSTAARLRVQLLDPSPVPLRAPPKSLDDWQVAAAGSWLVAVDNLSGVPEWLSDAICRAATGDGLVKRELFSDTELAVLAFQRVVTLTSIDLGALRGDFADRVVWFELERIPDGARVPEAEIIAAFERQHARLLGALCDLVAGVLAALPAVQLAAYPRLADYAQVLAAVDRVAGTRALAAYLAQRGELAQEVVEADAVAAAVRAFLDTRGGATWTGTASELYAKLTPERPPKGWPADAARLSARLRRAAEPLRRVGITVTFAASHRAGRLITIALLEPTDADDDRALSERDPDSAPIADRDPKQRVGNGASPASPASPTDSESPLTGDGRGPRGDGRGPRGDGRGDGSAGSGDAGDARFPTLSGGVQAAAPAQASPAAPRRSHLVDAAEQLGLARVDGGAGGGADTAVQAGGPCPRCGARLDGRTCWRCRDSMCRACGAWTGSPLRVLCIPCGVKAARDERDEGGAR